MLGDLLHYLYVGAAVLLFFGASIFVHEMGHYLAARWTGMEVLGFSIGVGPKIVSWHDKRGVEWALRWIPAGGFVKIPPMMTSELIEGESGQSVPPSSPWHRILVAVAGPVMNVLFALLIGTVVWQVGLPVPVNPSIIGYVKPGSPEAEMGIKEGDRIVSVDGKPVGSWIDVQRFTALARTNVLPVEIQRGERTTTYRLTSEINPRVGFRLLQLDPRDHPIINRVMAGGAAAAAGMLADDQFLSFAGVPVVGQKQLVELIQARAGQSSVAEILRGTNRLRLEVTPVLDPEAKVGRIGVELSPSRVLVYQLQRPGPTPVENIRSVLTQMGEIAGALIHSKQTGISAKDMSGPVGILGKLAADVNTDLRLALGFVVMVNINLALLNLLPIPVLDGGHILMALYEIVVRRRLGVRFQEIVTAAFAVALISFMLYVTFFDVVKRGALFQQMFQQESVVEPAPEK
jgi:regulator of sigma E protease